MARKATMDEDLAAEGLVEHLQNACAKPETRGLALEALASTHVWLATWEPHAEGFRTLINGSGEEALAAFTSEAALHEAAHQFGWLEEDGTVATHEARGADILRHAWTREYAFVIVDIGAAHSVEYDRDSVRDVLRDLDSTGPFRTSRPPAMPAMPAMNEMERPPSSFPPPVEPISTTYSMAPSYPEILDRLSELPTKRHRVPTETEPPTRPLPQVQPGVGEATPLNRGPGLQEIVVNSARIEVAGTYGAASMESPSNEGREVESSREESATPSSTVASLDSEAPTSPGVQPSDVDIDPAIEVPAIDESDEPELTIEPTTEPTAELDLLLGNDAEQTEAPQEAPQEAPPAPETAPGRVDKTAQRVPAMSIGDSIELTQLLYAPAEELLAGLTTVLRRYPEVEWASYCEVARPAGSPSPAVCLRVDDNYRDNVTAMIKELCEAGRAQDIEVDVLLMDGHDLLRKARERAFVFFPWKPKPFGG